MVVVRVEFVGKGGRNWSPYQMEGMVLTFALGSKVSCPAIEGGVLLAMDQSEVGDVKKVFTLPFDRTAD